MWLCGLGRALCPGLGAARVSVSLPWNPLRSSHGGPSDFSGLGVCYVFIIFVSLTPVTMVYEELTIIYMSEILLTCVMQYVCFVRIGFLLALCSSFHYKFNRKYASVKTVSCAICKPF